MAELITLSEVARRVVAEGWENTLSRQRVAQLADSDPRWPVPRDEWSRAGRYWLVPWDERLETYFRTRDRTPGPKNWRKGS